MTYPVNYYPLIKVCDSYNDWSIQSINTSYWSGWHSRKQVDSIVLTPYSDNEFLWNSILEAYDSLTSHGATITHILVSPDKSLTFKQFKKLHPEYFI